MKMSTQRHQPKSTMTVNGTIVPTYSRSRERK